MKSLVFEGFLPILDLNRLLARLKLEPLRQMLALYIYCEKMNRGGPFRPCLKDFKETQLELRLELIFLQIP